MSRTTEIVFSARDTGVESTMSRMRRSSNELGREMLQDAAKFSSSAKDAIKYYEDQIRLIGQRNRLESEREKFQARSSRDESLSSATSDEQRSKIKSEYQQRVQQIDSASREDKIQVDLLRELIETVKRTAQVEAGAAGNANIQDLMQEERRSLQDAGDEFSSLSSRYRDELRGNSPSQESNRTIGGSRYSAIETLETGVGLANNPSVQGASGAGAGMLRKAGPYGRAAAVALAAATGGFMALSGEDSSLTGLSSITGNNLSNLRDSNFGLHKASDLNLERSEFINRASMTTRAYGGTEGRDLEKMTSLQVQVEKAFGLQAGMADEIAVLTRTLSETFDSRGFMKDIFSSLYDTGVLGEDNNDMSRMEAIVSTATSLATDQLMRTGITQTGDNLVALRAFSSLGGAFKNDNFLQNVLSGVDKGLAQPGGAETQALKYNLLRQLNPKADVFDLQTMMSQGLGTEGYFQGVMDQVNSMAGDNTSKKILLSQMLPGVNPDAIKQMIENPDFKLTEIQDRNVNVEKRQQGSYSDALATQQDFVDSFKKIMSDLGDTLFHFDKTVDKIGSWFGSGAGNNTNN